MLSGFISTTLPTEISKGHHPCTVPQKRHRQESLYFVPNLGTWVLRGRLPCPWCEITGCLPKPRVLHPQPPVRYLMGINILLPTTCSFLQKLFSLSEPACFPALATIQHVLALRGRHQTHHSISVFAKRVQKGQYPRAALRASEWTRQQISSPRMKHCQNSLPGAW